MQPLRMIPYAITITDCTKRTERAKRAQRTEQSRAFYAYVMGSLPA